MGWGAGAVLSLREGESHESETPVKVDAAAIVCAVGLDSSALEATAGAATVVSSEKAALMCVSGGDGGAVQGTSDWHQFFEQDGDFAFAPREVGRCSFTPV